jgi:hypothetical protein
MTVHHDARQCCTLCMLHSGCQTIPAACMPTVNAPLLRVTDQLCMAAILNAGWPPQCGLLLHYSLQCNFETANRGGVCISAQGQSRRFMRRSMCTLGNHQKALLS